MLAIVTVHLAVAVAFWFLCAGVVYLAVLVAVAFLCLQSLRVAATVPEDEWCFRSDGSVLRTRHGVEQLLRVKTSTTIFEWGVWLHWHTVAGQIPAGTHLWLPDQFSREDWRRLKVWLRHFA